jgi:hypothetical protein
MLRNLTLYFSISVWGGVYSIGAIGKLLGLGPTILRLRPFSLESLLPQWINSEVLCARSLRADRVLVVGAIGKLLGLHVGPNLK